MKKLEYLGEKLIQEVRDLTSEEYLLIKSGRMRSADAQVLFGLISQLKEEQQTVLDNIVGDVIDRALHNILRVFEDSEIITIADKEKINSDYDLIDISDGVSGELYGDNGWISKYSRNLLNRNIF